MIYHQVRLAVKKDAPSDQLETALGLLRRMGEEIDVVESYCVGRDFGGDFDYGAMYALKDIDAYRTYTVSYTHLTLPTTERV